MKANGAPEKLYLLPNGLISYCRNTDEDVEYTRTDAFIENAVFYIRQYWIWNTKMIEGFKNYMEGE